VARMKMQDGSAGLGRVHRLADHVLGGERQIGAHARRVDGARECAGEDDRVGHWTPVQALPRGSEKRSAKASRLVVSFSRISATWLSLVISGGQTMKWSPTVPPRVRRE